MNKLLSVGAVGATLGMVALLSRRNAREISFRDKVVLITGGSRGLGLLIAREMAQEGARVVIVARTERQLEIARRDLLDRGASRVLALRCDVSDESQVIKVVRQVEDELGPVDVLVNNASIIQVGPAEVMSREDFQGAMEVNFWGTLHATQAVLPSMIERKQGRIANITSIGAQVAVPHLLPYTAAKFAAFGYSQGMHSEVAKHGIRVTTIVPGLMRTGSFIHALFKGNREAEFSLFSMSSSLPVITIDAERAARRIVLACRRGETFVTLGIPAKALRFAYTLLPGFMAELFGWVNRVLPAPQGSSADRAEKGRHHRTAVSESPINKLGHDAAERFNEVS